MNFNAYAKSVYALEPNKAKSVYALELNKAKSVRGMFFEKRLHL